MDNKSYGKVTVGYGTDQQKELNIINFIQTEFKDHRLISVAEIEDGSFLLSVENPESSGRATTNKMWLGRESLMALFSSIAMYSNVANWNIMTDFMNAANKNEINYWFSDNLEEFKPDQTI